MIRPYEVTMQNIRYAMFPDIEAEMKYREAHPKTAKRLGLMVCFMYFQEPDLDKVTWFVQDDERITFYDQREYVLWLGGVALNGDDERILRLAHRNQPSFDGIHGWRPRTIINWNPSQRDLEDYIAFQGAKSEEEWEHFDEEEQSR